jgi:mannose-6-phosphate isomerase-like protein (cupin superfamily)
MASIRSGSSSGYSRICIEATDSPSHAASGGPRPYMPRLIERPTVIQSAGNKPKQIEEYAGRMNSGHGGVSVARMVSPEGWAEPGQRPEFEEITLVLRGVLRVEHERGSLDVRAGQAVVAHPGEWVRYSSPEPGGAEYVAVCMPAFTPQAVHRDTH